MIALLQRVSEASVLVNDELAGNQIVGAIGHGILGLVGVEKGDTNVQADRLLERILSYRMFPDNDDRMNLDIQQVNGALLLVSQFTLAANTNKGTRASFTSAAPPDEGRRLFDYLVDKAHAKLGHCETGKFGANMKVSLVNEGPVTFSLRAPPPDY